MRTTWENKSNKFIPRKIRTSKQAKLIRKWVVSCEQGIRESRIDRSFTRPFVQNHNEHITAAEDVLVPELTPSGVYEIIVTDIFSIFSFAYPVSNQDATTFAKIISNFLPQHAYLQSTTILDRRPACLSHVIKEVADVLGTILKHATTKHTQAVGMLERSHTSIKETLKTETGERRSLWHKYSSIAVRNYHTTYHSSFGFESSTVIHGCIQ